MKSSKALVFGAVAIAAVATAAQQGITLRRELKADAKDVYKIDTVIKQVAQIMGSEMDSEIKAAQTYTMTTKAVDTAKGVADVETEAVTDDFSIGGSMAAMVPEVPKVPPMKVAGKLDATGRFTPASSKLANPMMAMMGDIQGAVGTIWIVLPNKPINVGDTWEILVPKNPFLGNKESKLTAKLVGEKELEGKKVWEVSVSGQLKVDADMAEVGKLIGESGGPMTEMMVNSGAKIHGTVDIANTGLLDKENGKTLSMTSTGKNKLTIDITSQNLTIESTGSSTSTIKLAK